MIRIPLLLKSKLRALPDRPGCYLMRDAAGRIIYVGKAVSLRQRVKSYFRVAERRGASPKLRSLVHSIADIDILILKSEADAILTENKLIKDYQPRFNVLLRDDKRFPLIAVDLCQKWPRFRLCRIRRNDNPLYHAQRVIYFGPYISSAAARAALEFVEKKFGLRKCTTADPGVVLHRHCLNDIIRYCAAPCIGKITPAGYRRRVEEGIAFLRGERPLLLKELQTAMEEAARQLNFEKAAAIRDSLRLLFSAVRQRSRFARTNGVSSADAGAGLLALKQTLGLQHNPTLILAVDISNISGKHAVGSMVAAAAGICRPALYRRFRITTTKTSDDAAMMSEVIERHFARLLRERKELPDLLLIDGGIVQLRASQSTLRKLGITKVSLAGLAKKMERIYVDDNGFVRRIVLPRNSPALQLLQRLRDEAHRFALAYHRRLRAKLIRESVLDDITGIGTRRKRQLLRHFGSLGAISRAPEKKIAVLPGIGHGLARKIKSALTGIKSGRRAILSTKSFNRN